jgi:hypothetical protein
MMTEECFYLHIMKGSHTLQLFSYHTVILYNKSSTYNEHTFCKAISGKSIIFWSDRGQETNPSSAVSRAVTLTIWKITFTGLYQFKHTINLPNFNKGLNLIHIQEHEDQWTYSRGQQYSSTLFSQPYFKKVLAS